MKQLDVDSIVVWGLHVFPFCAGTTTRRHPYLLPNLVGAGLSLLALPLVLLYIKKHGHHKSIFPT